jgi:hypothetical protein
LVAQPPQEEGTTLAAFPPAGAGGAASVSGGAGSPFLHCKHLLAARLAERLGKVKRLEDLSQDQVVTALAGFSI